jgi:hypothetical protein
LSLALPEFFIADLVELIAPVEGGADRHLQRLRVDGCLERVRPRLDHRNLGPEFGEQHGILFDVHF